MDFSTKPNAGLFRIEEEWWLANQGDYGESKMVTGIERKEYPIKTLLKFISVTYG